jgi:dihydroneopterin aldolase
MKIIKLKLRERFKYKRKVIIKNLILNMFIGIHNFEKKKKQRVRFNIEVVTNLTSNQVIKIYQLF